MQYKDIKARETLQVSKKEIEWCKANKPKVNKVASIVYGHLLGKKIDEGTDIYAVAKDIVNELSQPEKKEEWGSKLEKLVEKRWGEGYVGTHPYNEMYDVCKEIISSFEKEEVTEQFTKEELKTINSCCELGKEEADYYEDYNGCMRVNKIISKIERMLK